MAVPLVAGCGPIGLSQRDRPDAWVASEMAAVTSLTARFDDPLIYDADKRRVGLFAAANETISFQIVVDGGREGLRNVRLTCAELSAGEGRKIDPANVRVFRALPMHVSSYPPWYLRLVERVPAPADHYDALVPVDPNGALDVSANERLVLWVDLYVPREARAGGYEGPLEVSASWREPWRVDLALDVYEFVLPDARPLAAVGGFDHHVLFGAFGSRDGRPFTPARMDRKHPLVRAGLVRMRQLMRLAHEHRLDLFDKRIHPDLKRGADGNVRVNWVDYDAVVMPYLDGTAFEDRIGCTAWPLPVWGGWPVPKHYGGPEAGDYAATVAQLLAACRKHFAEPLELREKMFAWPYRGPIRREGYAEQARLARLVRKACPRTPILSRLPDVAAGPAGWTLPKDLASLTDIPAPPAHWFDPSQADKLAGPDNPLAGTWLSPGRVPYLPSLGLIASAADVRALPWFAMKYGCTGLFLAEVLGWSGDPFAPTAGEQTRLFYPGGRAGYDAVLPSVRLKRLRRGLQDLAYLWLLRQRQRAAVAEEVINAMVRYGGREAVGDNYLDVRLDGWVGDVATWQEARRLLAEEVQAAVHAPTAPRSRTMRLARSSFDQRARSIRIEQIRSGMVHTQGNKAVRITVRLDLYNEFGRDVNVRVGWGRLPEGFRDVGGRVRLWPMKASARRTVALTADCRKMPLNRSGHLAVPLVIEMPKQPARTVTARIPFVAARAMTVAPTIDGDLGDWPDRPGDTATDFRLLGRRGRLGRGLAARQTAFRVGYDESNLYLACWCREPNPAGMTVRADNRVHYEQLLACGEDLVEVLVCPGQAAKSVEDLYHIVIKPNGVTLTERGVRTDPPLGKARPWVADAVVAVGRGLKCWTIEMAVPLAAFGEHAGKQLWAVNFMRYATQGAESSSWAGAGRHFYDPRNLGTMYVLPESKP